MFFYISGEIPAYIRRSFRGTVINNSFIGKVNIMERMRLPIFFNKKSHFANNFTLNKNDLGFAEAWKSALRNGYLKNAIFKFESGVRVLRTGLTPVVAHHF